ncbi:hypothetical protein ABT278_35535 [Streptomyces sp. NPDC001228]|uniref:hypothetical protein n=1 Tax=Streptomyces sp. NPDC001228 TaxID=3154381 RepID=UPI00331EAF53
MIEPRLLPGDPSELHLRICYADGLWDTPQTDTLERWDVAILHRQLTHVGGPTPGAATYAGTDCTSDKAEWDRVNARIASGWENLGFRLYRDNVYLLSPTSQDLEEQRGALRRHLAGLGTFWRSDTL